MVDFNNTRIAFHSKSNSYLKKAKFLFSVMQHNRIVKAGKFLYFFSKKIHFPTKWILKPTIYKHFVGGANLESCIGVVNELLKSNVKSILDYSAEGASGEKRIKNSFEEIINSIDYTGRTTGVAFAVFKPSAMSYTTVLEKVSTNQELSKQEQIQYNQFTERMKVLAQRAEDKGIRLLIDAEHYAYQKCIDDICDRLMIKHNKYRAVVFNTFQMYRHDRMKYITELHEKAKKQGFIIGAKFVRGAYMDEERNRAKEMGYIDPICKCKQDTDNNFNQGVEYALNNISDFEVFSGTHNANSCNLLAELINIHNIPKNDERIYFAQLYGMSDNLTFVLANAGYNAAKYIPYAPIDAVIPYLIRRAEENTAMKGQTGRELELIKRELDRRRNKKQ